ncbi:MAG: hypothetical protein M1550_06890 [Deltaproteobacteria bacterium]|nr:hypothetical protein [Deltaproteobacteria bacterium]
MRNIPVTRKKAMPEEPKVTCPVCGDTEKEKDYRPETGMCSRCRDYLAPERGGVDHGRFMIRTKTWDGQNGRRIASIRPRGFWSETIEVREQLRHSYNPDTKDIEKSWEYSTPARDGSSPRSIPLREPKTPRVVELLRNAIEWQALLESGKIANQADIARREGITRARVTQVMGLLRLCPEIREQILSLPDVAHRPAVTERMLRALRPSPITAVSFRSFTGSWRTGSGNGWRIRKPDDPSDGCDDPRRKRVVDRAAYPFLPCSARYATIASRSAGDGASTPPIIGIPGIIDIRANIRPATAGHSSAV